MAVVCMCGRAVDNHKYAFAASAPHKSREVRTNRKVFLRKGVACETLATHGVHTFAVHTHLSLYAQ